MEKIIGLLISSLTGIIGCAMFAVCAKMRRDISGLIWLAGSTGIGAIPDIVYLLLRIELFLKYRFISLSIAKMLLALCPFLDYLSIAIFLVGIIKLTISLSNGKSSHDSNPAP